MLLVVAASLPIHLRCLPYRVDGTQSATLLARTDTAIHQEADAAFKKTWLDRVEELRAQAHHHE
jgi:hypothetical protein